MNWRERAACRGAALRVFFPKARRHTAKTWSAAREYCARCEVRAECLESVMVLDQFDDRWGFFGGMTPAERRLLRSKRDKALRRRLARIVVRDG